jgi:hypothetical protein
MLAIGVVSLPTAGASAGADRSESATASARLQQIEPPTPEDLAKELALYRAAQRSLAPSLRRATEIAREVERRYRLTGRAGLPVGEVTTMTAVASLALVAGDGSTRAVATDDGIHFALCPKAARPRCSVGHRAPHGAKLPRRQALELALRTFLETPLTLAVFTLPQSDTRTVLLVVERARLLAQVDPRSLARRLARTDAKATSLDATVDHLTGRSLFVLAGLVAFSGTRDSLVAQQRSVG